MSQAARDYAAGTDKLVELSIVLLISCHSCVILLPGVRQGIDEDDLVALQLGKAKADQLSEVQKKYRDKLKQKLAEVNALQACSNAPKPKCKLKSHSVLSSLVTSFQL